MQWRTVSTTDGSNGIFGLNRFNIDSSWLVWGMATGSIAAGGAALIIHMRRRRQTVANEEELKFAAEMDLLRSVDE